MNRRGAQFECKSTAVMPSLWFCLLYGAWLRFFVALYPFVWGEDALKASHEERLYDRRLHKW